MLPLLSSLLLAAVAVVDGLPVNATSELTACLTNSSVPLYSTATANFTQETKPFNLRLPFVPAALAIPTSTPQIQAAVACAAGLGIKVAAKSGGHSYATHGLGGEDGHLVLDLKYMNNVTVDSATNVATIQPAARLGNVALSLFENGERAISHGTCPGVGIGGHVLGGGYGFSSHTHGLALDNLIGATVVLANSSVVTASKEEHPDLFWALRGAGASYGIVTSMRFQTYPAPSNNTVFSYPYTWNQTQARQAFEALQTYANTTMPQEMNMRLYINAYSITVSGVYYGAHEDFAGAIQPLLDVLPGASKGTNSTKGWIDTLEVNANGQLAQPINYDYHETFFSKSLMTKDLSAPAMDDLIDYWFTTAKTITRSWYLIVDLHGGPTSAITKVPDSETAYPHRDALLKYEFYDRVGGGAFPSDGFDFLNGWVETVTSKYNETMGMYYNYADSSLTADQAHHSYWLGNYPRLSEFKTAVDPDNVFTNPQAVNSV